MITIQKNILKEMKHIISKSIKLKKIDNLEKTEFFNQIHKKISIRELNKFRLNIIKKINHTDKIKIKIHSLSKKYLDILVGNELAIQKRVNLSIQMPRELLIIFTSFACN